MLAAAGWAVYQFRLRQIRYGFSLVLEERARLAREIHDTLAQGFVGISSQLDAVAMCMPEETTPGRKYLDLARRMARHSLTEARRSVMDLRASALDRPGPGGGARIRHAHVDRGRRHRGGRRRLRVRSLRLPRRWSSICCASRRRR